MGPGGWAVLFLGACLLGYLFVTEKPFARRKAPGDFFSEVGLPKPGVVLERSPQIVESQAPAWQGEFGKKLESEGFVLVGDYSYSAAQFFWARIYLFPDAKSSLLLVNWVEGLDKGRHVMTNTEIYSFEKGGSFLLTASSQDGAARLLTGVNRPSEEQMSLHLKAVFAEIAVRPLMEEHRKRLAEREAKGTAYRELTRENILPSLAKIFTT